MSKLYSRPVEVRMAGEDLTTFLWRGQWFQVERCEGIYQWRFTYDPFYGIPTYQVKASAGACMT